MTSDGISSEDWEEVHELALAVANASDDEDGPHRERLFACLHKLISKYGELPSILATRADYVDDPTEFERLFLRAFDLALARGDQSNVLPESEMDRLEYQHIEEAIARLKSDGD
jgi:hypothetical protein